MPILSIAFGPELLVLWLTFLIWCGFVEGKSRPMEKKPLTKAHWTVISLSVAFVVSSPWIPFDFLDSKSDWLIFPMLVLIFGTNLVVWIYAPYKIAETIGRRFRKEPPRLTSE